MGAATVVLLLLIACSLFAESHDADPSPLVSDSTFGTLGQEGCTPPSPTRGDEVMATPLEPGASAYAKLEGASPRDLQVGQNGVKAILRVTGSGDLHLKLTGPDGEDRSLDWGPEPHVSSNYDRPGGEWGIGTSFDRSGCWKLSASRGSTLIADFWLNVH